MDSEELAIAKLHASVGAALEAKFRHFIGTEESDEMADSLRRFLSIVRENSAHELGFHRRLAAWANLPPHLRADCDLLTYPGMTKGMLAFAASCI